MANFKDSPKFSLHDDYYTPKFAWEQIVDVIPDIVNKKTGKTRKPRVYEAFCLNSNMQSPRYLEELGFPVIASKDKDFLLESDRPDPKSYDIIISNPPFARITSFKKRAQSLKWKCLSQLFELDKPFIIILNATNLSSKWFKTLIRGKEQDIKIIFSAKKINYDKYQKGGEVKIETTKNCSFNSIYVAYKILDRNVWL